MATASRVSLPGEFYDKTSDMLLVTPEPQYLYAEMFLGALAASMGATDLAIPDRMGLQLPGRTVGGNGANYSDLERGRLYLSNPLITSIFAAGVDFNGLPGNTIRINRPLYAATTVTEASRRIPIGSTISTVPIAPKSGQTNLTLYRYGGPYDQDNNRVAPYGIEAFDANMGVHKLSQIVGNSLKRDCHKFIDAVNVSLLDLASTAVYPTGMTAVNDATSPGMFPFTFAELSAAESAADEANLPTFADGNRVFVGTPTQVRQLQDDPQFARYAQAHPQYNALFPQYVKSVGKTHIFKSTTLTVTNNASSVPIHYGHLIAPGAMLAGMGRPLRVMPSTDDNYGETAKAIWLGDLAFGLADNTFVVSVRSAA